MSSNGYARSRPRGRHQRVPKTQCYSHPRFLQLVKELARIDDVKKQEELEQLNDVSPGAKTRSNVAVNTSPSTCSAVNDDCSNSTTTSNQLTVPNHRHHHHHNHNHNHNHNHHHHHHHNHTHHPPPPSASTNQQLPVVDCWPINISLSGANCCRNLNEAHSSNSCRSLECNQSSAALNDAYYRQSNNSDNLPIPSHGLHPHYQRHYNYSSNHQNVAINNQLNSLSHHSQHCPPSKSSATPIATTNNCFSCSKTSPIDQSPADFSNSDPDPRQDENRSKRKRSTNDPSNSSKKSSQPTSPSACSKRHKTSPEPVRPLSPSFTKCPICLLDCMDRDPSFTNTCFHLFCYICIENWSKSKATCPLCRTKFTKIIYNIRSASCFEEKVASPIRRDDDDDRIIYEQLHGLSANAIGSARNASSEETRLLFDNLRNSQHNHDVLNSQFSALLDHHSLNQRHVIQSFNSITTNPNFNPGVPHPPFSAPFAADPVGSSYIALIPSNDRSQAAAAAAAAASSGPAITSAYATNTSLTNSSSDSSNRGLTRMSRSGRFIYSRNYDLTTIDGATRVSRSTNTEMNPSGISLEPRHHHHHQNQMPHGSHHQHHNQHSQQQQQQHRATSTIELVPHRQVQRIDQHPHILHPYLIPTRHYNNPHIYSRRPYTNPHPDQHILDNLYRQMPDM